MNTQRLIKPMRRWCVLVPLLVAGCGDEAKTAADILGDVAVGAKGLEHPMATLQGPYATLAEFCHQEGGIEGTDWRACAGKEPQFLGSTGETQIEGATISVLGMQIYAGVEHHTYLVMARAAGPRESAAWYALGPISKVPRAESYPMIDVRDVAHEEGQSPHDFLIRHYVIHERGDDTRSTTRIVLCRAAPATAISCTHFDVAYDVERSDGRDWARLESEFHGEGVVFTLSKGSDPALTDRIAAPGRYHLTTTPAP